MLFVGQREALRLAVVDDRQYELSEGGGDHGVHPSKMARYAGTSFPVRHLEGFEQFDALVGDIGEDPEADDRADLVEADLQLGGELEEVGEQPQEVGLVHRDVAILLGELLQQLLHQLAVAVVQEVHGELLQQLGDVLVGGDVVDHRLHPHPVLFAPLQQLQPPSLLLLRGTLVVGILLGPGLDGVDPGIPPAQVVVVAGG